MIQAFEALIPIILLIGLGTLLFQFKFIDATTRAGMDRFTYWIALPALFIQQLASADFHGLQTRGLLLVLALATLLSALLAALLAWIGGLDNDHRGVFVQVGFRANMAFVGLPLILFAMGERIGSEALIASALIALAALIPLNNLMAVMALLLARQGLNRRIVGRILKQILLNPLIASALIGSALGWFNLKLPIMVDRPLELLGQTALALALVSLGGALIQLELRGRIRLATLASLFKVLIVPALTLGLAILWNLPPDQRFIALIFGACPTATASYILTTQLGGDDALAAATIVMSTLLSLPVLTTVLLYFPP